MSWEKHPQKSQVLPPRQLVSADVSSYQWSRGKSEPQTLLGGKKSLTKEKHIVWSLTGKSARLTVRAGAVSAGETRREERRVLAELAGSS